MLNLVLSSNVPLKHTVRDWLFLLLESLPIHRHAEFLGKLVHTFLGFWPLLIEVFHLNFELMRHPAHKRSEERLLFWIRFYYFVSYNWWWLKFLILLFNGHGFWFLYIPTFCNFLFLVHCWGQSWIFIDGFFSFHPLELLLQVLDLLCRRCVNTILKLLDDFGIEHFLPLIRALESVGRGQLVNELYLLLILLVMLLSYFWKLL